MNAQPNMTLCLVAIMLIPLAAAGLALIHQGLGRSRSAAHAMLATLCALGVAAIVFVLIGFSFAGFGGLHDYQIHIGQLTFRILGSRPLFARGLDFTVDADPHNALLLCLQMLSVGLCAIIPISAGSDRWRLGPICASTAILAAFIWPLFAYATWSGLGQDVLQFHLYYYIDAGGAGAIQVVGGLAALSVVWIVGPRRGKYSGVGVATAIPGHNIVLVLLGCLLALVGWIALDTATSTLMYSVAANRIPAVIINAILSASSGLLAALVTTTVRYRKPDASICANGWIAGLVAGSAACGLVPPYAAILIGLIAGILVAYLIEILELHLLIDDPGGAISVHAGAGIWGLLAAAIWGPIPWGGGSLGPTVFTQLLGIATLLGLIFPLIHGGNLLLNRLIRFRVDSDGDWQGMDIRELGAGAYPEFVIHADEFVPR